MAFVRSPKFYVLNGVKELITALIETWTAAEEDSLESLCRKGNAKTCWKFEIKLLNI